MASPPKRPRLYWRVLAGLTASVLLFSGCHKSDRPALGFVSGSVTFDSKPLAGARVIFAPTEGGRASVGTTDAAGRYELIYIRKDKGAKLGSHQVKITIDDADDAKISTLPPQYNMQTTLRADVKSADNTIDFALTSTPTTSPATK